MAAFRSLDETVAALGADGAAYRRLMEPLVRDCLAIADDVLGPLRSIPGHPVAMARFGLPGLLPMEWLVRRFESEEAKALLAGVGAHAMSLTAPLTSAFGTLLALTAHAVGWPVVAGGSSTITDAMVTELERLGGTITTGQWVGSLAELPRSTAVVLDTSPKGLLDHRRRRPVRTATGGPSVGSGTVPACARSTGRCPDRSRGAPRSAAGPGPCISVGRSPRWRPVSPTSTPGRHPDRPYCIIVQAGVADPTRAPAGQQALWGYCHVPSGSDVDMTAAIEAQIERFAPGFSDLVVARSVLTAADEERHNPNYVGGDIAGGASTLVQTVFRPTISWNPYRTPLEDVYLCSASTAPGGGVHGMCGVYAARTVLHDHFGGAAPLRG